MLRACAAIFAGLLGLAFGSFLNVCLSRWPEGESVVAPRSHCRTCQRTLAWWENIPLVSWIALRGRCRTCGAQISWRYPLVELTLGVLWAIPAWNLTGMPAAFLASTFDVVYAVLFLASTVIFLWLLVALAVLDAEHLWLPDMLTWPGIGLGVGFRLLEIVHARHASSEAFARLRFGLPEAVLRYFIAIALAAGMILAIRWIYWTVRQQEGIGLGDAKLMALLAAWLGFSGALLSFAIGVVVGALIAVAMLGLNRPAVPGETWAGSRLPLGTFLCMGGIVTALWGQPILQAYMRWAGLQ